MIKKKPYILRTCSWEDVGKTLRFLEGPLNKEAFVMRALDKGALTRRLSYGGLNKEALIKGALTGIFRRQGPYRALKGLVSPLRVL